MLARLMTIRHAIAVGVIVVCTLGGFIVLDSLIASHRDFVAAVGMAAKVRPVSQRVALLSLQLTLAKDPADATASRAEIVKLVQGCTENYGVLRDLVPRLVTAPEIHALLDEVSPFSQALAAYQKAARSIASAPDQSLSPSMPTMETLLALSPTVLAGSDRIVQILTAEHEEQERNLRLGALAATITTLAALLLNVIAVFRPLVRRVTQDVAAIADARQLAEEASHAKSDFLARMSHELRTPLNAILGFSEVIAGEMFGPAGNPRYVEYARDINGAGRHLLSIVNDILDLSRIEAGRLELAVDSVDVAAVIEEAARLTRPLASTKRIELTVAAAPDLPPIRGDALRLKQALLNLLANAVKFTGEGGHVQIAADRHNGYLHIRVVDDGVGIAVADLAKVFEPFLRVEGNPISRQEGSGLGLSLARRLVELHGGTLTLDSRLNHGTTVLCRLPAELQPLAQSSGRTSADALH